MLVKGNLYVQKGWVNHLRQQCRQWLSLKLGKLIHFPFFVSLFDYWSFTHAQKICNKLKIMRKRTAQWTGGMATLLPSKNWNYRCISCDSSSLELQKKNCTRPDGKDSLFRKVITCPAVTLVAWILHWSPQLVKILIFAIVGYLPLPWGNLFWMGVSLINTSESPIHGQWHPGVY